MMPGGRPPVGPSLVDGMGGPELPKLRLKTVLEVIELFQHALEPDYVVLGGGNAEDVDELPPDCRLGRNEDAFLGGFRLWI